MDEKGQNGRREMYVLSLDNNRIFWILSIALLVLVFLFLLGYWIGHDNSAPDPAGDRLASGRDNDDKLNSLKKMLDDRTLSQSPPVGGGGLAPLQRSGDDLQDGKKEPAPGTDAKDPLLKRDGLSGQEKREFDSLKKKQDDTLDPGQPREPVQKKTTAPQLRVRKRTAKRTPAAGMRYAADGRYSIQVASLATSGSAGTLRNNLEHRGFQARVNRVVVGGKQYYRVQVGQFRSHADARQALARLRSGGHGGFITAN